MTSPQAAALDVAPADATSTIDNHQPANDVMDLTAEAQAPAIPVEVAPSQQEHPDKRNQQQPFQQPVEESQNGPADQNGLQIPPQQGETAHGAGDAAIPNSEDLQNNHLGPQPTLSAAEMINALAALRDTTMMYPGVNPYYPFSTEQMNAMEMSMAQQPFPDLDPEPIREQQIQAYAKLDFDDGSVYMNTYNIFIGRDRKAAKKVLKRERALEALGEQQLESRIFPPAVSESGGILAHEDDYGSTGQPKSKKARSKRSKASKNSHSSHSSQKISRGESPVYEPGVYPIQYDESDTEAAPVDPTSLRPNPNSCPTVGIHPASNTFKAYKTISRRHVKIAFNPETSVFELHVMGNNGCWLAAPGEDLELCTLVPPRTIHTLVSGSQIQIGEVRFTFVLPNDDGEGASEGLKDTFYYDDEGNPKHFDTTVFRDARGKEMSTDHSQAIRSDAGDFSEDDDSEDDGKPQTSGQPNVHGPVDNGQDVGDSDDEDEEEDEQDEIEEERDSEDEDEEDGDEEEEQTQPGMLRQSIEEDESPSATTKGAKLPAVAGRKGPGRPPKNGVMSKRAEKELKKQAEEAAAAEKTGAESSEAPKKGKVGRPRKHPLPDPETANKPKRKYTKRKPKENQDGVQDGTGSGEGTTTITKVKKEKPFKPARSPTPVYNEEDLTPEQLAKPAENYVVIIYNSMLASPHKEMGLPQIYNAIKRSYPFFALKAETKGWESSVRHNLSGNPEVFEKGVKDGKGHMWSLKPGATVDKEKKKKAAADPQFQGQPQNIQQAPHNPHGQYPGMNYAYTNYHQPPNPNYPMGQPQFMPHPGVPYPPPPNGYAPQQNDFQQPPGPWQPHPPNFPVPSIPPAMIALTTSSSYSSPYAPKPAETNPSPSNNQSHASPYGSLPPSEQQPPQQLSPPVMISHPSQPPQYQLQEQNPYTAHTQAPHSQMQYPSAASPQQHPTPPNLQQPQPLHFPQSQPQTQAQHVAQPPPIQQTAAVHQNPASKQPSPPQQPAEAQPAPSTVPGPSSDVAAKVESMLGEFQKILMEKKIAKEDVINASISLVRRDGDKAVPDPNSSDKNSMKLIIETLRGALASIEGSGFTAPQFQRSFQPASTTYGTSSQASTPVNGSSTPVNRPASTIPRPPLGVARPPMHTGSRRTDSGSPVIAGSIQRPASVSGGGPSTLAAAGSPVPAHSGSANSPNGASAATSTPVSVSEGISKTQAPAISTPIERLADVDVTMSVGENDKIPNFNGQPQQIVGQKRSRDEVDGSAAEGQENVKRVAV